MILEILSSIWQQTKKVNNETSNKTNGLL